MYSEYQLLIRATEAVDAADKAIGEAMATPVPTFESGCAAIKSWHRRWASADAAVIASHQASQALVGHYQRRITADSRP